MYEALAKRFDTHHQLAKGGAKLDYITGEQCITRLNDTLGVDGWGFEVVEHGQAGDDFWARGRLTAYFPERTVIREQFGGVKNRGGGMEMADAMKGAATDALKKAASLIGVALYLSDKDDPASHQPAPRTAPPARQAQATPVTAPAGTGAASRAATASAPAGGDLPHPEHAPLGEPQPITDFFERTREAWHASRAETRLLLDPQGLDDDLDDASAVKVALARLDRPNTQKGLDQLFTLCTPKRELITA